VLTLLLVALLAATVSQLVMVTSVDALAVRRESNTLAHELAVDSILRIAAERLRTDSGVHRTLDHYGQIDLALTLGECQARCRLTDDGAKFDPATLARDARTLRRSLSELGRALDLPECRPHLQPLSADRNAAPRYAWFDQLFDAAEPDAFFHWSDDDDAQMVWSDAVTCWGSGKLDVRRARPEVLSAVLQDIDRSLARRIVALRQDGSNPLPRLLADLDVETRAAIEARLGYDLARYSFQIQTAIGGDVRRWYLVATISDPAVPVHYRGQVQW
jgi:hypothetical protein